MVCTFNNYVETLLINDFRSKCSRGDIDAAVSTLCDLARSCCKKMVKTGNPRKKRQHNQSSKPWYDAECRKFKREVTLSMRRSHRTNDPIDKELFKAAQRFYKAVLKRKERDYKDEQKRKLFDCLRDKDAKRFWSLLDNRLRSEPANSVTPEQWYNFYSSLYRIHHDGPVAPVHDGSAILAGYLGR